MEIIKILRKQRDMTQVILAKKASINRSHLAQIENGKRSPRIETLAKIASALGCDVRDLV